ncbi:AMIN domain-containing protein [Candidatus Desantisbacteria bacterium]|nr:AMIN domain-containing protein [Candidatus Desantisbacteria bacterium]
MKKLYLMTVFIYVAMLSSIVYAETNLLDVQVEKLQDRVSIVFVGDAAITNYDSVVLTDPPAIVIDLPKTTCTPKEIPVSSGGITRIQIVQQKENQTRIIVGLIKSIPYQINKIPNGLELSITNPYADYTITGIDVKEGDDRSMVVISTNGSPQYKYFETLNPPRIILDFLNATSDAVKDITVDGKCIAKVGAQQRFVDPVNVARITVETKESVPYSVLTQGKTVLLTLKKYSVAEPPANAEKKEVKKEDTVRAKSSPAAVKRTYKTENKKQQPVATKKSQASQSKASVPEKISEKPKGQTISMDFKDADLLDVLRLIAQKVDLNIVPGAEIKGIVNLRLDNVPWETALTLILKAQGYTYIKEGKVVFVDTRENLVGELMTRVFPLNYALAGEVMGGIQGGVLTPTVGKINVDVRTNALIITDTVGNFPRIEQLIKELDTETKQVMIEAKIVEVYLNKTNQLGFMWNIKDFLHGFEMSSLMTQNTPMGDRGELVYGKVTTGHDINGAISAMISEGKANVLSSPSIRTLHGREAKIMIGEEIPYQQTTTQLSPTAQTGVVQTNVVFREVGVKLTVVPFINPDNFVTLSVKPEVSSFKGWAENNTPIISTKSSITQLLIKDGETVIIGGIIDDHGSEKTNKVPVLGDLPFVGRLFRMDMNENRKTELVIFITPHIIKKAK